MRIFILLFADSLESAYNQCNKALSLSFTTKDSNLISDSYQDMSVIQRKKTNYKQALYYAKKSYKFGYKTDESKLLNLAQAYVNVDSLIACNRTLKLIHSSLPINQYTKFYIMHIAAIKGHHYEKACQYADSSYFYIEKMYGEESAKKDRYYLTLVHGQYEKGKSEGRIKLMYWLSGPFTFSAIVIIFFLIHSYKQYQKRTKFELYVEERERKYEKKKQEEVIRRKEIQLSTMRNYILKKIDIVQKVVEIKDNTRKMVTLSEGDWQEIRLLVDTIDDNFTIRLKDKFPDLSIEDINFMTLLRLKMSSKVMANIYGIREKSIRQKLFVYKSKVGIENRKDISLRNFIEQF